MSVTTPFPATATAAGVLHGVDLSGQRHLVTGGSSGLGAATVRALAGAGAEVVVATRDPGAAAPLTAEFPRVRAEALDLGDLDSVRAFTKRWSGRLDALVGNAGIMAVPERRLSPQGWELQLAVNYLGHFALVTGLHEALRPGGRVVLVSSGAYKQAAFDFEDPQFERQPYDPFVAYARAKRAEIMLAGALARRWAADGITANALSPGFVHTNLQRHLDDDTMRSFGAMDAEGNLVTPDYYKTPEQGAATSVLLAASPLVAGVTGRYFEDNQETASDALDPAAADRLWEHTVRALGSPA
ncbi:SDR family NAD(P)-dependent oxidoreductase [Symbioplanes lichenis]|uniref:SDR family NAD(P)-dependent oxidoreductase n=1 Tax=Symbioplanes lichenis TaxID=1629072 RepID=UPI002739F805|nr:SDR family NAD(P)-dependent oxidoreductase [Actinoplanes lichenis]